MKQTSLDTYETLRKYFGEVQIDVYRCIVENPGITRNEITEKLQLKINSVCGRVNELLNLRMIQTSVKRKCNISGRVVETLVSLKEIDYDLLKLKKYEKKRITPIYTSDLPAIYKMYEIVVKSFGNEELMDKFGDKKIIEDIKRIKQHILNTNEDLSLYIDDFETDSEKITFKAESDSREIFHKIIMNRETGEMKCDCEDNSFRKKDCKHMKRIIKKYNIEK